MEILQSVRKPIKHSDKPSDYEVSYVDRTAPALRDELFAELEKVAIPNIPYKNPTLES